MLITFKYKVLPVTKSMFETDHREDMALYKSNLGRILNPAGLYLSLGTLSLRLIGTSNRFCTSYATGKQIRNGTIGASGTSR